MHGALVCKTASMCGRLQQHPHKSFIPHLQPCAHEREWIADKLSYAAGHHATPHNGCMRRVAIVLFQQLVFEQLKETDVNTCIRQDATLQAAV